MLYLTCTTISGVDLAQYGVSLAKDWVSVESGTSSHRELMPVWEQLATDQFDRYSHLLTSIVFVVVSRVGCLGCDREFSIRRMA